eukprot:14998970-Alexandrium_andersonii.AAC.1
MAARAAAGHQVAPSAAPGRAACPFGLAPRSSHLVGAAPAESTGPLLRLLNLGLAVRCRGLGWRGVAPPALASS